MHFIRKPLPMQIDDLLKEKPELNKVDLGEDTFLHSKSWFALLWTCQRVHPIKNKSNE
jgi:hypothetical protein